MTDTARFASMADPACNRQFHRLWVDPHDAAALDRRADIELQHGHHTVAEHLARRAAELRLIGGDRFARQAQR